MIRKFGLIVVEKLIVVFHRLLKHQLIYCSIIIILIEGRKETPHLSKRLKWEFVYPFMESITLQNYVYWPCCFPPQAESKRNHNWICKIPSKSIFAQQDEKNVQEALYKIRCCSTKLIFRKRWARIILVLTFPSTKNIRRKSLRNLEAINFRHLQIKIKESKTN